MFFNLAFYYSHLDLRTYFPQFPIYVSPRDVDADPEQKLPDSEAKGFLVDTALLFIRASKGPCLPMPKPHLSTFRKAYEEFDYEISHKLACRLEEEIADSPSEGHSPFTRLRNK